MHLELTLVPHLGVVEHPDLQMRLFLLLEHMMMIRPTPSILSPLLPTYSEAVGGSSQTCSMTVLTTPDGLELRAAAVHLE